MSVTKDSL